MDNDNHIEFTKNEGKKIYHQFNIKNEGPSDTLEKTKATIYSVKTVAVMILVKQIAAGDSGRAVGEWLSRIENFNLIFHRLLMP